MGRIIAIDYGSKRTGLAVTDPLRIIATPLQTVPSAQIINFLKEYDKTEGIDLFVLGLPKTLSNEDSSNAAAVRKFAEELQTSFPAKKIEWIDERFTSAIALNAMIEGGMKKKDRRDKANVDRLSATLILQSYLSRL